MTDTQQGVAQRVLSAIPGNPKLTEFEAICCHAGAEEMLKQLSAEAQAVMTEYDQAQQRWHERGRADWVDGLTENQEAVREFCDRLGLDLEGEES